MGFEVAAPEKAQSASAQSLDVSEKPFYRRSSLSELCLALAEASGGQGFPQHNIMGNSFEDACQFLRGEIIGRNRILEGPFGPRLKVYLDYTASGQGLQFVNLYINWIRENFANTHTEDSATGLFMTQALGAAVELVKECVNAASNFIVICTGTGCTGAMLRLQQILGIYMAPATWEQMGKLLAVRRSCFHRPGADDIDWHAGREAVKDKLRRSGDLPLVIVGGYEHHTNELSWREGLCDIIRVNLTEMFELDLKELACILKEHRNNTPHRRIIGSFSACSNVTGMCTDLVAVSQLLRKFGALFFVDYAASAPYEEIDCNPAGNDDLFDGFVLSPHKFLGGDGSCGLLVLRESLYNQSLPPTFAGGGTVKSVRRQAQTYSDDVVERENAGTPGALQIYQCAMAFAVKAAIGVENIQAREHELLSDFLNWVHVTHNKEILVLGNQDASLRHAIVSFNIIAPQPLHPRFVTVLLSDLFGIQTRAGCSCAGPHGLDLLGISETEATRFFEISNKTGLTSWKPGWCRLNLHYTMDADELWYVKKALSFIVKHGSKFLSVYSFDLISGAWCYKQQDSIKGLSPMQMSPHKFGLETALQGGGVSRSLVKVSERRGVLEAQLRSSERLLETLPQCIPSLPPSPFPDLRFANQGPQTFFVVALEQCEGFEELRKCMDILEAPDELKERKRSFVAGCCRLLGAGCFRKQPLSRA